MKKEFSFTVPGPVISLFFLLTTWMSTFGGTSPVWDNLLKFYIWGVFILCGIIMLLAVIAADALAKTKNKKPLLRTLYVGVDFIVLCLLVGYGWIFYGVLHMLRMIMARIIYMIYHEE